MSNVPFWLSTMAEDRIVALGRDGLCNPDNGCGCLLGDLMPCGSPSPDCMAGYKHERGGTWVIWTSKEPPSDAEWQAMEETGP